MYIVFYFYTEIWHFCHFIRKGISTILHRVLYIHRRVYDCLVEIKPKQIILSWCRFISVKRSEQFCYGSNVPSNAPMKYISMLTHSHLVYIDLELWMYGRWDEGCSRSEYTYITLSLFKVWVKPQIRNHDMRKFAFILNSEPRENKRSIFP